jgi:hypothetical protein
MAKFNYFKYFRKIKESLANEFKYLLFWKVLPVASLGCGLYYILKYKLYQFNTFVFTQSEEKTIAKKLYPLFKYRYIDKAYGEDSKEFKAIQSLYKLLIDFMKLNLKQEAFVFKSDLLSLFILPTGNLFISDVCS